MRQALRRVMTLLGGGTYRISMRIRAGHNFINQGFGQ